MQIHRSRTLTALAALAMVATTAAIQSAPANAAPSPSSYVPRWCADGNPAPCLVSLTHNGEPVTSADHGYQLQMTAKLKSGNDPRFQWQMAGTSELTAGDTFVMTWNLGSALTPDRTENFAGGTLVRRLGATHQVQITAHPVLMTQGCNEASAWPWTCPTIATGQSYVLSGEVHQLGADTSLMGFDQSQNAQGVNGIFLETNPDGSQYLSTEMVNSHFLTDGSTLVDGGARFRISYAMLRSEFGIPDPETMVASSLTGQVNSSTATFKVMQDPNGGGMIVDVEGMHFSRKVIKVRRGTIVPTKPGSVKAKRIGKRARLTFTRSRARGARPTGYVVRCRPPHGSTVVAKGKRSPIVVRGLKAKVRYTCTIRATSKAGPGTAAKVKLR